MTSSSTAGMSHSGFRSITVFPLRVYTTSRASPSAVAGV